MSNMINLLDIYYSIQDAISDYQFRHGKDPQCIFMSSLLIKYIEAHEALLYHHSDTKMMSKFHGINVIVYDCSEPQYYLAEGPGMFRKYCEDTETIYK